MPIEILMPALSPTMTHGNLAKWTKAEGDTISAGDVLCEIETDKATMEVEAVDEGVLGKILVPGGSEGVAVNAVIALLLEEGEDAKALDGYAPKGAAPAAAAPAAAAPAPVAATPAAAPVAQNSGSRVTASPLAKRIAAAKGLDLATVQGSGPRGRIVKRDVENAQPGAAQPVAKSATPQATAGGHTAIPHTQMRRIIAKRLTESARDIPHFNVTIDAEIDKLLAVREDLNATAPVVNDKPAYKISVNDIIVKATALALKRVPECNASFTDDAILRHDQVDMSIAVAIDGGLITPIVFDCANKGLAQVSQEIKALAKKARDGKLMPEEFQGGTFTISNLGMFGVKSFNSIINPPQGGILSVGAGEQRPVVKNGQLSIANVVTLTLAVDHRCIDGAMAAAFAKELKAVIENPVALML
ncbi:MAG TPA: pyruvate dehydrogenase complex dihydrolipoamide acetyltransferase [Magnetovibrio sp.]